ncbi:MAG: alcohol dehydrogenase catalytic domain-containing protein [Sedimentisphaerales bacterium]
MKAVRFYDKGDIRVEDIAVPEIENGGLLVKVEACAICGTDLKMYLSGNPRVKPPQTIGHEFVGEIVKIGDDVRGFAAGERITMATSISCCKCDCCRAGFTNRCENLKPVSYDYPGAFAEYIAIPPAGVEGGNVVKVTADAGDIAALAEPISCAINAQILANVKIGDTVVVVGFGPLGAIHTEVAKANGATRIIITESSQKRLQYAKQFDIDEIIDVSKDDAAKAVMKITNGVGADVVIVTAPSVAAQEQSLSLVRKGGMVNLFASLPKGGSELKLDSRLIHYRELFISGASDSTPYHVQLAVKLLAKGLISEKIITHRLGIDNFIDGIELMKSGQSLKVLILPEK